MERNARYDIDNLDHDGWPTAFHMLRLLQVGVECDVKDVDEGNRLLRQWNDFNLFDHKQHDFHHFDDAWTGNDRRPVFADISHNLVVYIDNAESVYAYQFYHQHDASPVHLPEAAILRAVRRRMHLDVLREKRNQRSGMRTIDNCPADNLDNARSIDDNAKPVGLCECVRAVYVARQLALASCAEPMGPGHDKYLSRPVWLRMRCAVLGPTAGRMLERLALLHDQDGLPPNNDATAGPVPMLR